MSEVDSTKHKTMPMKWRVGLFYPLGPRVEDPIRVAQFTRRLLALSWAPADHRKSLNEVFEALSDLAHAEIRYYYNRRCNSRRLSGVLRYSAWLFGTVGIVTPLASQILENPSINFLSWGYVFFAIAGALLVADNVFAGTSAHQRYVRTQLEVERLYSLFSLDWQKLLIAQDTPGATSTAERLIERSEVFAEAMHQALGTETAEWKETMDRAKEELKNHASGQTSNKT